MSELIAKIIPLGIAAAFSPTLLTATIIMLASKTAPRWRTFVYWVGSVLTLVVIAVIVLLGSSAVKERAQRPSVISSSIDIVLAVLLFYIAYKEVFGRKKPTQEKPPKKGSVSLGRALLASIGLGIIMTVTDLSSIVLYLSAAKETADARLGTFDEIIVMSIMVLFVTLPIFVPLILTLAATNRSAKLLSEIKAFLQVHSKLIITFISVVFGIYLLYKGASGLIA